MPTAQDEEAFWLGLQTILQAAGGTHEQIDDALRSFLDLAARHRHEFLHSEDSIARLCRGFLAADLFQNNQAYVRRQMLYCFLQDDEPAPLFLSTAILLHDGWRHTTVFAAMQEEGAFTRLIELLRNESEVEPDLHRVLLELLYEFTHLQRLPRDDLAIVDDAFVLNLFRLVEDSSDDADDPYLDPAMRSLLALNDQYFCQADGNIQLVKLQESTGPLTNRVMKILSNHGPSYRTFNQNLIRILNRKDAVVPQLLILRLLHLLFTTEATHEYFYTNDLYVLVDIIIRKLYDMDYGGDMYHSPDSDAERNALRKLRHTYLRVLFPLLKNTQLAREGSNYKREQVRGVLHQLVGSSWTHIAPVDDTVLRLVLKCREIDWLHEDGDTVDEAIRLRLSGVATPATISVSHDKPPCAEQMSGTSIATTLGDTLSKGEVAAKVVKERPTVPAPRRRRQTVKKVGDSRDAGVSQLTVPPIPVPTTASPPLVTPPRNLLAEHQSKSPFADDSGTV